MKEWQRGIRKFFTFSSVEKAELELKEADERLVELEKVAQTTQKTDALQKALNNYLQSQERLAKRLESLEQNKNVEELSKKLSEKEILHQALFDELIGQLDETQEGKEVLKEMEKKDIRRGTVIAKPGSILAYRKIIKDLSNINETINKLPYPEGVRELKALEVLTRIEENLPEESKKGIETAKEVIQERLIKTEEIQKAAEWEVEQGSSDLILIEGVPVETKTFEKVVEKLEKRQVDGKGANEAAAIGALKTLKSKLPELKVIDENTGEGKGKACPTIAPDISKGKEECLKAAKHLDEIYPGCDYAKACEGILKQKSSLDCGPAPGAPGNWKCIDGAWKDISQCGKIQCISYDPVCGTDGKTYSCGEADALACGIEIAYKGECKKEQYPGIQPFSGEQPATSSKSVSDPEILKLECPEIWEPVCGVDGKTYSNKCIAKLVGVAIQYQGECKNE